MNAYRYECVPCAYLLPPLLLLLLLPLLLAIATTATAVIATAVTTAIATAAAAIPVRGQIGLQAAAIATTADTATIRDAV